MSRPLIPTLVLRALRASRLKIRNTGNRCKECHIVERMEAVGAMVLMVGKRGGR